MPRFRSRIPYQKPHETRGVMLPRFVHEYLQWGAGEGSRNATLHRCAQQYYAAAMPIDAALQSLLPRAMADGLSQHEACMAIDSAYRSTVVTRPIKPGVDYGHNHRHSHAHRNSSAIYHHGSSLTTNTTALNTSVAASQQACINPQELIMQRAAVHALATAAQELIALSSSSSQQCSQNIAEGDGISFNTHARVINGSALKLPAVFDCTLHGVDAMKAALNAAFLEGEHIAICPSHLRENEWAPGVAVIHSRESWMKRLPHVLRPSDGGCYAAINPLRTGAQRRLRDEIISCRHVLVEWEGVSIEDQARRLHESRLPLSLITLSGGRSVHGWVRVDAPDLATWEMRRDIIFAALECDNKNKDISRLSRLPGFMRGEYEQCLLGLNCGMGSWDEWEQWVRTHSQGKLRAQALGIETNYNTTGAYPQATATASKSAVTAQSSITTSAAQTPIKLQKTVEVTANVTSSTAAAVVSSPVDVVVDDDGLPPIITLDELFRADPKPPPEVVKGVLYQGTKMMIGAPSKARKSWVLLDLALSVVSGTPWLGFPTTQGKVLMLNFELKPFMLNERLQKLARGRNYSNFSQAVKDFHLWNLRGRIHDLAALAPKLIKRIRESGYSLVILDPIYKGLGDRDENHAGDINQLLTELEQVAQSSGAAVLYTHHFAKGNAGDRSTIDRTSGSGVWARDPDTIMMLTPPPPVKKTDERGSNSDKYRPNSSSYRDKYKNNHNSGPTNNSDESEMTRWDYEVEIVARAHPRQEPFHITWQGAHYERERSDGSSRQVIMKPRDGGMACEYGETLASMPRLRRDRDNNVQCPILNWIRLKTGLGIEASLRVFDTLRQPRYPYLKSEGEAWWSGTEIG